MIEVYGRRGLQVIARHTDVLSIASFGRALEPKVANLQKAIHELKKLQVAQKELATACAAQASELHVVTLTWRTRMQSAMPGLEAEDIAIEETKLADAVLARARRLLAVLEGRDEAVPEAAEARAELEAKHSSTNAAFEALQAGRVALQDKQADLRGLALEAHKELVNLRKAVRHVLGSRHGDYQYLRIGRSRVADEPPAGTRTDDTTASTVPSEGTARSIG